METGRDETGPRLVVILCESCCLSEYIQMTYREVLSPKLLLGIGASKTIPTSRRATCGDAPCHGTPTLRGTSFRRELATGQQINRPSHLEGTKGVPRRGV